MTDNVISYNCKGFNVSKVPYIKILLDRCSVLLLQETWLFSNQFTQFTKYFDKYKSINIIMWNGRVNILSW